MKHDNSRRSAPIRTKPGATKRAPPCASHGIFPLEGTIIAWQLPLGHLWRCLLMIKIKMVSSTYHFLRASTQKRALSTPSNNSLHSSRTFWYPCRYTNSRRPPFHLEPSKLGAPKTSSYQLPYAQVSIENVRYSHYKSQVDQRDQGKI